MTKKILIPKQGNIQKELDQNEKLARHTKNLSNL